MKKDKQQKHIHLLKKVHYIIIKNLRFIMYQKLIKKSKNNHKPRKISICIIKVQFYYIIFHSYYYSFYVTFSSQTYHFHTIPYFKIQLQTKKKYKIYVDFNLILTFYRINNSNNNNNNNNNNKKNKTNSDKNMTIQLNQIDQKSSIADKKRIYLNFNRQNKDNIKNNNNNNYQNNTSINNTTHFNTYHRIIFNQPDYFSFTDTYILSIKSSLSLRAYQLSLAQFHLLSIQQRSKLSFLKQQPIQKLLKSIQYGITMQLKEINPIFKNDVVDFYKIMIKQPIKQYKKLALTYQHIRSMMITMNNSTIQNNEIKIPYLHNVGTAISLQPNINQQSQLNPSLQQLKTQLHEYYQTQITSHLYLQIYQQSHLIYLNIQSMLINLINLLIKINYNVFSLLAQTKIQQKFNNKKNKLISYGNINKNKKISYDTFIKARKQFIEQQFVIEQIDLKYPFIMLENYTQTNKTKYTPNNSIDNLVILVHGYQGSDYDLQLARYFIQMYNPHTYCLMSSSIQDNMDESIQYLGIRLSTQIKQHLSHTYNSYKRINFVGYSLGGIIIRESMRYLQEYKQKMNLYITLASPHIGTIDSSNYLIKTGIWYLINFQNAKNIKQLHCQYQTNQNQTFILKKLSQCETLTWFEKFIVISSEEDSFVPYNSSRLDEESSSIITKNMCENIIKRIKKLQRVQVCFDVQQDTKTIDKILGRKAHIQFLQNKQFLNLIFKIYSKQF